MPAVSTRINRRSPTSSGVSIASAGGARSRRDDHAIGAGEAVDERGLADVRPADDREAHRVVLGLRVARGQQLDDAIEQVARAEALCGRDGHRLAEAETVEVRRQRQIGSAIDLVRRHHDRQRAAPQDVGDLGVARSQSGLRVDHEHGHVGVGDARAGLLLDLARELVLILEVDAARIDQRQLAPVPVGRELLAVAGHPRAFVDDRLPGLGEAVDQRGLSDVRIADDRDLHGQARLAEP